MASGLSNQEMKTKYDSFRKKLEALKKQLEHVIYLLAP